MCNTLTVENNYNLLGYFENLNVEVVSSTNALFSFPSINEAILFNSNINLIEDIFNKLNNTKYKFIALSIEEWKIEKDKYIKCKDKNYKYIDEKIEVKEQNIKNKNIAEDIFGNDIIEIR